MPVAVLYLKAVGQEAAIDRSIATLTRLSKWAASGVPLNTRAWLPEMPDLVVPPEASLVSLAGASTSRSRIPR